MIKGDWRIILLINLGKLKAAQHLIHEASMILPDTNDPDARRVFNQLGEAQFKYSCALIEYEKLCRSPLIKEDKLD